VSCANICFHLFALHTLQSIHASFSHISLVACAILLRCHYCLFLLAAIMALAHGAPIVAVGLAIWAIDVAFRYFYLVNLKNPKLITAIALPADIIRIEFPNPLGAPNRFRYRAGQFVFLCLPELGIFEWHPFSLSSSPNDPLVSIHIRALGGWTRRLHALVKGAEGQKTFKAYIEGPYGSPMIDIDSKKYQIAILISGGIGVTPMQVRLHFVMWQFSCFCFVFVLSSLLTPFLLFQSICNDLLDQCTRGRKMKKIWFIW
jgi:predicted ferric reductase